MHNIEIWKLVTDIALTVSILLLCYRFVRSGHPALNPSKFSSLQVSLRALIGEADTASRVLNDQLLKRQQSLEKVLTELESVERRIGKEAATTDAKRAELERAIKSGQNILAQIQDVKQSAVSRVAQVTDQDDYADRQNMSSIQESDDFVPEPPRFEEMAAPTRVASTAVNIYGQPVGQDAPVVLDPALEQISALQRSYGSLASTVEREILDERRGTTQTRIEDVYAAAEGMLRAGKDVERVALNTQLPIEDVKIISQMLTDEDARVQATEEQDNRLGVLTGLRRQTQVL